MSKPVTNQVSPRMKPLDTMLAAHSKLQSSQRSPMENHRLSQPFDNGIRNQTYDQMTSNSSVDREASPIQKPFNILNDHGSAKALMKNSSARISPMAVNHNLRKQQQLPFQSLRPSSDLKTMDVKSSTRRFADRTGSQLLKGKAKLGLDFQGVEIGGENLVSQSPNKNQYIMAQSIEVGKNNASKSQTTKPLRNSTEAQSELDIVDRLKKPPAMYKPEMNNSGGFMVRSSIEDAAGRDSMVKIQGSSALSINFPTGMMKTTNSGLANQERIPTTATGVSSKMKQQSKISLYPRQNAEEDEQWAEVANFNKLLDIKQKLDEASEIKRKADMQRAYLDQ